MNEHMSDRKSPPMTPGDSSPGQALRRSLVVLLLIVLGVAGLLFFLEQKPAPQLKSGSPGSDPATVSSEIPTTRFTDVTTDSGIRFTHNNGARGEKLLPETMGGGVAFFDFDNDGDQDLLFINGTSWPGDAAGAGQATTAALYRNDGKGHFEDVTRGSGLDVPLYGMGTAVGDYDNDGLVDVFITVVGGNRLFRNEGNGHFTDVTAIAGVGGPQDDWSTSAAWIDYDNDGKLDLFVGNYVAWSRKIDLEVGNTLPGIGRAYGRPMNFSGSLPRLYHNDGNGRFSEVSASSGVQVKNPSTGLPMGKSLGVAPVDLNDDGWIDLIVANDTVQNFVFTNRHDGTFREIGAMSGLAFDTYGGARGAMGIDTARFQDDNSLGITIGNFANEMTAFYVSQTNSVTFTDEAITQGIGAASKLSLTFGVFFFDYDLDGWLDVLTANGHIEEEIARVQGNQQYRQPAQLFWNSRGVIKNGGFVLVPREK